jgi:O-antigen biosynthesis protein WbqP
MNDRSEAYAAKESVSGGPYARWGKRFLDVAGATFVLLALSPLLLLVTLMIKIFDPGPIIFQQTRVGRQGLHFLFFKFRSMPVGTRNLPSDQLGEVQLTWIGRFLRRSNVDELPQLFNVLRGDMSLIGPRPPIPTQVQLIESRRSNGALALRPGLTGLAQVSSYSGMTVEKKAFYDGQYARQITLIADVRIVFRTLAYLSKPPPVY